MAKGEGAGSPGTPLATPLAEVTAPTAIGKSPLSFGETFTGSMAAATWNAETGWSELSVTERRPLLVDPAMVGLHYGQLVFEGLKAYRLAEGTVGVFRPDEYASRMRLSARRLAMPEPPAELFLAAVDAVTVRDQDWLPAAEDVGLYLRPVLIATEPSLALRPARDYLFLVIAFVADRFFAGDRPITVRVEEDFVRAVRGGVGAAKFAGNYAPTYLAQLSAAEAGCDQVVWLDAVERRYLEELGGMNLFFVHRLGDSVTVSTPPLTGTILPGITRDTVLELAKDLGYEVRERLIDLAQWRRDSESGVISETFACGTAAVVTPIGSVVTKQGRWQIGAGEPGPVTLRVKAELRRAWQGLVRPDWVRVPVALPKPCDR